MSNDITPNNWSEALSNWINGTFSVEADSQTSLELQTLEDRVLYSAGPVPVDMIGEVEISETPDLAGLEHSVNEQFQLIEQAFNEYEFSEIQDIALPDSFALPVANELVIVDKSVEGYEELVDDLLSSKTNGRQIEVAYLESNKDGIKQISSILSGRSNLSSIHLISHGADGELRLGNTVLNAESLSAESSTIESWKSSLAIEADLLIYGCNVAQSDSGEAFVDELAQLLDADISASVDLTGHHSLGGDWHFEYQVGVIESNMVFSSSVETDWLGSLVAVDMSSNDRVTDGSASRAIAVDYDGRVTQVYSSNEEADQVGMDVYMVQFDKDGTQIGTPTKVNSNDEAGNQTEATIAMNDNGDFVVVWSSENGGSSTVKAKIFNKDGTTHELEVGTQIVTGTSPSPSLLPGPVGGTTLSTIGSAKNASVSMNESGDFIIVWEGSGTEDTQGIYGQRFGLDGVALDQHAFLVNNTIDTGYEGSPDVAINDNGEFVVAWDNAVDDTTRGEIYVTVYDENLDQLMANQNLADFVGTYFTGVSVDIDNDTRIALAATGRSTFSYSFLHTNTNVWTLVYDSVDDEWDEDFTFAHDTTHNSDQYNSSIVIADDEIVVAWSGETTDGLDSNAVSMAVFDWNLDVIQSETNLTGNDGVTQSQVSLTSFHGEREWALGYVDANDGYKNIVGNETPVASDQATPVNEGEATTLTSADFGYDNSVGGYYADNDPFNSITIVSVTGDGQLLYNGTTVAPGTKIEVVDLDNGSLVYTAGFNTGNDTAFEYTVSDGLDESVSSYFMHFDVHGEASDFLLGFGNELVSLDGAQPVNNTTVGNQSEYAVEALDNGSYVVAWQSEDPNSGQFSVLHSIYDSSGNLLVDNTAVDIGDAREPEIVALNDGYLLIWHEGVDVYGQRYDNLGNKLSVEGVAGGSEFEVAQIKTGGQFGIDGAGLADGGFVLAWSNTQPDGDPDTGVTARLFNANGQASDEFTVNQTVTGIQRNVSVTAMEGNNFAIGWVDLDSNSRDVKARFFEAGDPGSGAETTLHSDVNGLQKNVQLETLADGRVVAVWEDGSKDGDGLGLFGAVFHQDGSIAKTEFAINQNPVGDQVDADLVALGDGGFLALWESEFADADGTAIVGLRFDANFDPIGDEFIVNSHRGGNQYAPQATVLGNGEIVVAWGEADGGEADGNITKYQDGVFVDRFQFGVSTNEDQQVPLFIDHLIVDTNSESFTEFVISGIPAGVLLTDGINTSPIGSYQVDFILNTVTGKFQTNGVDWDIENLAVVPGANSHEDFSLTVISRVSEFSATNEVQQTLFVKVAHVDDGMELTQISESVYENSSVEIAAAQLSNSVSDLDSDTSLAFSPTDSFTSSTINQFPSSGIFVWNNDAGTQNITLDASAVSYVSDSGSDIPSLNNVYEFDGSGGGTVTSNLVDTTTQDGAFEIWLKPNSLVGDHVILDWSDDTKGIVLYQRGDQIVLEVFDSINFPDSDPIVLVAEGLSDTEFSQVSFQITGDPLDGVDERADIRLHLNGELMDQVVDAQNIRPSDWSTIGNPGLGQFAGNSFVDTDAISNFEGQIGQIEIFSEFESGYEAEKRYLNTINASEVVEIEGQVYAANSSVSLPSGAVVFIDANGNLTYDPNGQFDSLLSGQTASDTITYRVNNGAGESTEFTIDISIDGLSPGGPTDLSTGITLNTEGNDAYLMTDDTDFLDGVEDITFEIAFSSTNTNTQPLISYQTNLAPTGSVYHNDFLVQYNSAGTLSVYLPGGNGGSDIYNLNGIDYSTLMNGDLHTLSFVFDSSNGNWNVHVDGVVTDSGSSNTFKNANFTGGGVLVFGQEQDSPDADYDSTRNFSGTIHDIRIWADKLTTNEIASHLNTKVDPSNIPSNLIANWQFETLDNGTSVASVVDTGNPLILAHVTEPGFTSGNAEEGLSVSETAPNGTHVGTLFATDADAAETFTYTLLDDANGRFAIDSATGEVTVADSTQLNFANDTSHQIRVQVADGANLNYVETFDVQVKDNNFKPVVDESTTWQATEDTTYNEDLNTVTSDPDGDSLFFTILNDPANGSLNINGDGTFEYVPNADFSGTDHFEFEADDGNGEIVAGRYFIFVNPVNDTMVVSRNTGATFAEGSSDNKITTAMLETTDVDDTNAELTYTLSTQGSHGVLKLNGVAILDDGTGTFTQADIDAGQLKYDHGGGEINSDSFSFSVVDGGEDGSTSISGVFNINVTQVNDAPLIGLPIPAPSTPEDQPLSGDLSSYVADADPSDTLAYSLVSPPANGSVTINLNGSFTYTPNDDYFGNDSFDFQVDDGKGGIVPATFNVVVTPVNDSPDFAATNLPVEEGSIGNVLTNAHLTGTDIDNPTSDLTFVVQSEVSVGTLRLNGVALGVGDDFTQADIDSGNLTYDHDGTETSVTAQDSFDFTLSDDGSDGATPVSGTFVIDIVEVDDPPVANSDLFSTDEDTPLTTENVLGNDSDAENDSLQVFEYTQPNNGTVVVNPDGSFDYTPNANWSGTDNFQYTMGQVQPGLIHHWDLGGNGDDLIGGNDLTHNGGTSIPSDNGNGLQFDEVSDYAQIAGVTLDSNFTISFDFKLDDNSGSFFQYVFSDGDVLTPNSLNIYFAEESRGNNPNTLKTAILDSNDPTNLSSADALNVPITGLMDGQWHNYTLVVENGVGAKVYIDGTEAASSTNGADSVALNNDIYLGARKDMDSDRFYGGALDSLQIFDRALSEPEVSDPATELVTATVNIEVTPINDTPVALDNVYGVAHGGSITVGLDANLLYNDSDIENDPLSASVETDPSHGTVVVNADGTFEYTHHGTSSVDDSFQYRVEDGNGGFTIGTVTIHVDECGFVAGDEFLVHDPSSGVQDLHTTDSLHSDSAVATRSNGDYVVTWTDQSGGDENVMLQMFDFNGVAIGDPIHVNEQLPVGEDHHASVAMAADGSFVVVWSNQDAGGSEDGTPSSIYYRMFNADGSDNGVTQRVTTDAFSDGNQESPDIAMNESGAFAVTWHGAGPGGKIQDAFLATFNPDGTPDFGPQTLNTGSFGGGLEAEVSVAIGNDGSVATMWDDGNTVHFRFLDSTGTLSNETTFPQFTNVDRVGHSSLDLSADGLLAVAVEVDFKTGTSTNNTEIRLQLFDMSNPTLLLMQEGNQVFAGGQTSPSVSFGDDGTLVLTYQGNGQGDADGIYARKFQVENSASGAPFAKSIGDEFLVNQTTTGSQVGASVSAIDSENFVVVWSGEGVADSNGVFARQFGNQSPVELSGRVVEDVNADSDITNDGANSGVDGANVYLYRDGGDNIRSSDDILYRTTTTDASGNYAFSDIKGDQTYWVVVDSRSITPSGINADFYSEDAWADQTYGNGGAQYGGLTAGVSDDASSLLTSQHVSEVIVGKQNASAVDFGFSFNVVTNVGGGGTEDHDGATELHDRGAGTFTENYKSVQGSLRQFITNANAVAGENTMRFVPGNPTNADNGTDQWWRVQISEALPEITDANTTIDGTAYDSNVGTTVLDLNSQVHSVVPGLDGVPQSGDETTGVGSDGVANTGDETFGVGADGIADSGDEESFTALEAPMLEIQDIFGVDKGISVMASDVEISHIAINGFGIPSQFLTGNIFVSEAGARVTIRDNVIGAGPGSSSAPPTAVSSSHGIIIRSADSGVIENNFVAYNEGTGIKFRGTQSNPITGWIIQNNEVVGNGLVGEGHDGIDLILSSDVTIQGNYIHGNQGFGIDSYESSGSHTISSNTISANGLGGNETGGIRLFGTGNLVNENVISDNAGAGVLVVSDFVNDSGKAFSASTENTISKNSFFNNSGIAIDLLAAPTNDDDFKTGDEVSVNDDSIAPDLGGGNLGIDHPELASAYFESGLLHVTGSAPIGISYNVVEAYVANSGAGDTYDGIQYGEGQTYIGTIDTANVITYDAATGEFHVTIPEPPSGWPSDLLVSGAGITFIGTESGNTSEFSNVVQIRNIPPVANDDSFTIDEDQPFSTVPNVLVNDSDANHSNSSLVVTKLTDPTNGTVVIQPNGDFDYVPNPNFHGTDSFTYTLTDPNGASDVGTVTITVVSVNDDPEFATGTPNTVNVAENQTSVIVLSVSDVDITDTLSPSLPTGFGDNNLFQISPTGTITFIAPPDFENPGGVDDNGSYNIEVLVEDGQGGSATHHIQVNLTDANDAPTFVPATPTVIQADENQTEVIQLVATDQDGDAVTFSLPPSTTNDNSLFTISPTGTLEFLTAPDFENPGGIANDGTYTVEALVTDPSGAQDVHFIEVQLQNVDEAPVANDDVYAHDWMDEEGTYVFEVDTNDIDVDGDFVKGPSTVSILSGPANGNATVNADGDIVYSHNGSEDHQDQLTYQITDASGLVDTATVLIEVQPVDDPTITNDDDLGETQPSQPLVIDPAVLLANDSDIDNAIDPNDITIVAQPDGGTVELVNGQLVFTPDNGFANATTSFEYQVIKEGVASERARVSITVTGGFVSSSENSEEIESESTESSEIIEEQSVEPGAVINTSDSEDEEEELEQSGARSYADNIGVSEAELENELESSFDTDEFKVDYTGATYAYASRIDDLSMVNLSKAMIGRSAEELTQFESVLLAGLVWGEEGAEAEFIINPLEFGVTQIAASAASFLTVGYLAWIVRGGVLLTTFMSSIPAWSSFDIVSVIEAANGGESIEQMVDQ